MELRDQRSGMSMKSGVFETQLTPRCLVAARSRAATPQDQGDGRAFLKRKWWRRWEWSHPHTLGRPAGGGASGSGRVGSPGRSLRALPYGEIGGPSVITERRIKTH